jgi:hypothetical protein
VKKEIVSHKICLDGQSLRGIAFNLGLFPLLEGPPHKVNSMPRLSLDEKKNYVILDSIRNDYEVDNVTKRIYQAILQGIKTSCHFPSFSPHFKM